MNTKLTKFLFVILIIIAIIIGLLILTGTILFAINRFTYL